MSWLASFALHILHFVYWFFVSIKSWSRSEDVPLPLDTKRSKTPAHLALLLANDTQVDALTVEEAMIEAVEKAVSWCRVAGIGRLTVYDRQGLLARLSVEIHTRLLSANEYCDESVQSVGIKLPPTPPPSDDADSRPLSPDSPAEPYKLNVTTLQLSRNSGKQRQNISVGRTAVKRRRQSSKVEHSDAEPVTLHIISRQSGKAAIASVAHSVFRTNLRREPHSLAGDELVNGDEPSLAELRAILEGKHGFPSPDLMLIHHVTYSEACHLSPELHGFPPWNIRLTEIYRDDPPRPWRWWRQRSATESLIRPLEETQFRRALDVYAAAEQRLGK